MNCNRHILAIIALISTYFTTLGQVSQPFIGIESIAGGGFTETNNIDSVEIGDPIPLTIRLRNYTPNSSFFGSANIFLQTSVGASAGLNPITLVNDYFLTLSPNTAQLDTFSISYTPEPQYFVLGGGITTVVVWPLVNAPTDEPLIKQVYALNAVGLSENRVDINDLSIFPNPANEKIAIVLNEKAAIQSINIYSINGQLVHSQNIGIDNKNYAVVNTSNLTGGMYVVEAVTNKGTIRHKFIKM